MVIAKQKSTDQENQTSEKQDRPVLKTRVASKDVDVAEVHKNVMKKIARTRDFLAR